MPFVGLEGVAEEELEGRFAGSPSQMIRLLGKSSRVVSSAGDEGSLTVWIDDAGAYRASFDRYMVSRARGEFKTKAQLREFVDRWFPAQNDLRALCDAAEAGQ